MSNEGFPSGAADVWTPDEWRTAATAAGGNARMGNPGRTHSKAQFL